MSDIDEVPNPEAIKDVKKFFEPNIIFHFAQDNCIGYLNLVETTGQVRSMTSDWDYEDYPKWLGSKLFSKSILEKYTMSELRSKQENENNYRICSVSNSECAAHSSFLTIRSSTDRPSLPT